jgi:ketosteroid isomerase-like protein
MIKVKFMRLFVTVIIAAAFLLSCSGNNITVEKSNENIKLINDFFQHFNNHDWQKMASMYADTAYFLDPSYGTDIVSQTPVQTAEKYAELAKIFPDLKDSIVAIYASGEKHVITEFISKGTGPDGAQLYLPIATVFTIENGKIIRDNTYYDNMESPQQDPAAVKK